MITIGRKAAGVAIGSRTFTGFFAWMLWLVIRLFNLIGFRNRVMVLINRAWDYFLYTNEPFVMSSRRMHLLKRSALPVFGAS